MKRQSAKRAHWSRFAALWMAAALFLIATPLAAQIQPKTPAPSLTPQNPAAPAQPATAPPPAAPAKPAPAPTPETLAKGKSIILAAAKASGGDAFKTVKSVEVRVSGQPPRKMAPWISR